MFSLALNQTQWVLTVIVRRAGPGWARVYMCCCITRLGRTQPRNWDSVYVETLVHCVAGVACYSAIVALISAAITVLTDGSFARETQTYGWRRLRRRWFYANICQQSHFLCRFLANIFWGKRAIAAAALNGSPSHPLLVVRNEHRSGPSRISCG